MAIWYVYSGAGGGGTGADWANAFTTLQAAITAGAAGDTYYVAQDHAETSASTTTITFKGTSAAIDKVICVNRGGSVPPVSADIQTTPAGSITTTGNVGIILGGNNQYVYMSGIAINVGTGVGTSGTFTLGASWWWLKNCSLSQLATGNTTSFTFGPAANTVIGYGLLDNTTLKFGATADIAALRNIDLTWRNTPSAIQGATLPTTLWGSVAGTSILRADGVDLSALGAGKTLVAALVAGSLIRFTFLNCKLGASVTMSATQTAAGGAVVDSLISNASTANYDVSRKQYEGALTTEIVIVPTSGGATDGTTPVSWKLVSTANVSWVNPFPTFAYAEWVETVGAPVTRTFEVVNDGVTLTNADLWVEVEYLGSAATPVSSLATTGTVDVLTTGTNLTTSAAAWTTTGIASPVRQKIAVTFTPAMKGLYRAVFKLAKASQTVWINPRANEV